MSATLANAAALLADLLTVGGATFFLISAIGLLRLPDFFCRLHAPTKAATLGVVLLGLASLIRSLMRGDLLWLEDLLIIVFLFLTVPVSAQLLARGARNRGEPHIESTAGPRSKAND